MSSNSDFKDQAEVSPIHVEVIEEERPLDKSFANSPYGSRNVSVADQSSGKIGNFEVSPRSVDHSVDHKVYKSNSAKFTPPQSPNSAKSPWKFGLSPNLENGTISLIPTEKILQTWQYISTSMSLEEWIATFCSFGLYYLITRSINELLM